MPVRLIVFDFDGTLADSFAQAIRILEEIGPSFGLNMKLDPEKARQMSSRQVLREIGIRFWRLPKLIRAFQAKAAEVAHTLPIFPQIPELLDELARRQYSLGVLSSNREDVIRACLQTHQIEDRFQFVHGSPKLFGKARLLRRIAKDHKLPCQEVLYIGDEVRDIEAAQKAKVPIIAVNWGFHAEPLLLAANPECLAKSHQDILNYLDEHAPASF